MFGFFEKKLHPRILIEEGFHRRTVEASAENKKLYGYSQRRFDAAGQPIVTGKPMQILDRSRPKVFYIYKLYRVRMHNGEVQEKWIPQDVRLTFEAAKKVALAASKRLKDVSADVVIPQSDIPTVEVPDGLSE